MHSALSIASIVLAATGALALPQATSNSTASTSSSLSSGADTEVRVILQSQSTETGSQTVFKNVDVRKHKSPVGSSGPFETIEISVGADAQQDLRCQALDLEGKPLIATRGANTVSLERSDARIMTVADHSLQDITFSDADKGEWTFKQPSEVSRIICDPEFVAAPAGAFQVRVILSDQSSELGTQTVFDTVEERVELPPTASTGPFDTVEIALGELVDPTLRCALLNGRGREIVATRGENTDVTFADGDNGPWSFDRKRFVSKIICDADFVAAPQ